MNERQYYLAFSVFPGIGPVTFSKLLSAFGSAKKTWEVPEKDLEEIGIRKDIVANFCKFRQNFSFEKYLSYLEKQQIGFVAQIDSEYPLLLKNTPKPPLVLFYKGNKNILLNNQNLSIVGTRKISSYGREVTKFFVEELVSYGYTIVSGLAFGVDALAHQTTIDNLGKTIAVLGCGVDTCVPSSNYPLYREIIDKDGIIVSAFIPGTAAVKGSFPARNAIIAGLSLGVIVTEGAQDSGALITAQKAKELGRPVFAVPGPITSGLSRGPNYLLKQGAIPVLDAEDIIKSLEFQISDNKSNPNKNKLGIKDAKSKLVNKNLYKGLGVDEQKIIQLLTTGPLHFDEIVRTIGKSAQEISSLLSILEIKGMVSSENGIYSLSV